MDRERGGGKASVSAWLYGITIFIAFHFSVEDIAHLLLLNRFSAFVK